MKMYGEWIYRCMYMYIHVSFTSTLAGGECSASHLGPFDPGQIAYCVHWIGAITDIVVGKGAGAYSWSLAFIYSHS
jgi:hypothetical protein